MMSLKSMCIDLDLTILEYFNVLDEILIKQKQLESLMKEGFLYMAKARYSMGAKSVGSVQYSEKEMEASTCVDVIMENKEIGENSIQTYIFRTEMDDNKPFNSDDSNKTAESNVRQRTVHKNEEENNETTVSSVTNAVQDLKVDEDKVVQRKKDPIKMFGVLVPKALRDSQDRFKSATKVAGEIATLKNLLEQLQVQYQKMLKAKEEIVNNVQI